MGRHGKAGSQPILGAALYRKAQARRHSDQRVNIIPCKANVGVIAGFKHWIMAVKLMFKIIGRPIGRIIMEMNEHIMIAHPIEMMPIGMMNQRKIGKPKRLCDAYKRII